MFALRTKRSIANALVFVRLADDRRFVGAVLVVFAPLHLYQDLGGRIVLPMITKGLQSISLGEDRSQRTLFPERLDNYLAEDNPVRAIDDFVDELEFQIGPIGVRIQHDPKQPPL
jgi:hypothetical protein